MRDTVAEAAAASAARPAGTDPAAVLRRLDPVIRRAPSAHNTQPWLLTPFSGGVRVGWDPGRVLGPSDPTGRDIRLSVGAFIETCLVAAAADSDDRGPAAGATGQSRRHRPVGLAYVPDVDPTAHRAGTLVPATTRYPTPFGAEEIRARRTWRGRWRRERVADEVADELTTLAGDGGGRLVLLPCADLRPLCRIVNRWFFANPGMVTELRTWSRLTRRAVRQAIDGLTYPALGIGPVAAATLRTALRPAPQRVAGRRGLNATLALAQRPAFAGTGDVVVLLRPRAATVRPGGEAADDIEAGRLLLRLWLALTRHGLAAHPHNHLLDCPATALDLTSRCGATDERVVWVARIGRPVDRGAARRRSPRRPVFDGPT